MRKELLLSILIITSLPLGAIDVSPSKDQGKTREKNDQAGSGPGWFSGVFDGNQENLNKKIDRVKNIHRKDFDVSLTVQNPSVSINSTASDSQFAVQPFFTIQNKAKTLKTFSFQNSQKYDFVIMDSAGTERTRWSSGQLFNESIGSTLINPGESVRYTEMVSLFDGEAKRLPAGEYTLVAELKGYPEFTESIKFNITP